MARVFVHAEGCSSYIAILIRIGAISGRGDWLACWLAGWLAGLASTSRSSEISRKSLKHTKTKKNIGNQALEVALAGWAGLRWAGQHFWIIGNQKTKKSIQRQEKTDI